MVAGYAAIVSGAALGMAATLSPNGLAYKQNGRNRSALQSIDAFDSDGDGFAQVNGELPQALFYDHLDPGSFTDSARGLVNYPPA